MRYAFSLLVTLILSNTFVDPACAQEAGGAEVFDDAPSADTPAPAPDPVPLDDSFSAESYTASVTSPQGLPAVQQAKPPEELLTAIDHESDNDGTQGPLTFSIYEGSSSSSQSFTGANQHLASPSEGKVFRAKDPRRKKTDPLARPAPPAAISLDQSLGGQEVTLETKKDEDEDKKTETPSRKKT